MKTPRCAKALLFLFAAASPASAKPPARDLCRLLFGDAILSPAEANLQEIERDNEAEALQSAPRITFREEEYETDENGDTLKRPTPPLFIEGNYYDMGIAIPRGSIIQSRLPETAEAPAERRGAPDDVNPLEFYPMFLSGDTLIYVSCPYVGDENLCQIGFMRREGDRFTQGIRVDMPACGFAVLEGERMIPWNKAECPSYGDGDLYNPNHQADVRYGILRTKASICAHLEPDRPLIYPITAYELPEKAEEYQELYTNHMVGEGRCGWFGKRPSLVKACAKAEAAFVEKSKLKGFVPLAIRSDLNVVCAMDLYDRPQVCVEFKDDSPRTQGGGR